MKHPGYLLQATPKEVVQHSFKENNYCENIDYISIFAVNDWVAEMFAEESLCMERVGQVVISEEYGNQHHTKYLIILYRPLDKGKSKEVWHVVAIQHPNHRNDRWYAAEGWCYGWYERPRNKTDRRQLLLF